jgi:hypothetical protein
MNNGRYCDNCEYHLSDEDFAAAFSWSYTCPECGFKYNHSSEMTTGEQVEKFNAKQSGDAGKG